MKITPKLSTEFRSCTEKQREYIYREKRLEIQILTPEDITPTFVSEVVNFFPEVEEFVFHLPDSIVNIELYFLPNQTRFLTALLINDCCKYPDKKFNILFHASFPYRKLEQAGLVPYVKGLVSSVEGTNITFLLENDITQYDCSEYKLAEVVDSPHLKVCFDTCHYEILKRIYGERYKLPKNYGECVKSVHFSTAGNNDGLRDEKTHSSPHESVEQCEAALEFLRNIGVDLQSVMIVAEINEPDDYVNRPRMMQELEILDQIQFKA